MKVNLFSMMIFSCFFYNCSAQNDQIISKDLHQEITAIVENKVDIKVFEKFKNFIIDYISKDSKRVLVIKELVQKLESLPNLNIQNFAQVLKESTIKFDDLFVKISEILVDMVKEIPADLTADLVSLVKKFQIDCLQDKIQLSSKLKTLFLKIDDNNPYGSLAIALKENIKSEEEAIAFLDELNQFILKSLNINQDVDQKGAELQKVGQEKTASKKLIFSEKKAIEILGESFVASSLYRDHIKALAIKVFKVLDKNNLEAITFAKKDVAEVLPNVQKELSTTFDAYMPYILKLYSAQNSYISKALYRNTFGINDDPSVTLSSLENAIAGSSKIEDGAFAKKVFKNIKRARDTNQKDFIGYVSTTISNIASEKEKALLIVSILVPFLEESL